jgi:hypothetical protein
MEDSDRSLDRQNTMPAPPNRKLTIVARDPALTRRGEIITEQIEVPNERLNSGPKGYRTHVIDFDASAGTYYQPLAARSYGSIDHPIDPYSKRLSRNRVLSDPYFHAHNVYAIVMRTIARFEFALGRRVSWSFPSHQIKLAPHAFSDLNAFYSKADEGILFGYYPKANGGLLFTCLSHDVVVHETTHALVDGLRNRYNEESIPDQLAFHEGFADVVALLSVFSLRSVVRVGIEAALGKPADQSPEAVDPADLAVENIKQGILFGLAEEFGEEMNHVQGAALRRSVQIEPDRKILDRAEFQEAHRRGEVLVAAVLHAFIEIYRKRLSTLGRDAAGRLPVDRVIEEGAVIADHMLNMAIRAIDYAPPVDVTFGDFLSAMITADCEIHPDDSLYSARGKLIRSFAAFGIQPASSSGQPGLWKRPHDHLNYAVTHFEAMQRASDEVFRFVWENRFTLGLCEEAFTRIASVRPSMRTARDGFICRETVAEYIQILDLKAGDLPAVQAFKADGKSKPAGLRAPKGLEDWRPVRLYGGGVLIFDEYGRLKYHVHNSVLNNGKQNARLDYLYQAGLLTRDQTVPKRTFAVTHGANRALSMPGAKERIVWH